MSAPPVEPAHPVVADASGKATCAIDETVSDAVALSVNDPAPAGRKKTVLVAAFQNWSPAPLASVGAVRAMVGPTVLTVATAEGAEGADWLPTRSEILYR